MSSRRGFRVRLLRHEPGGALVRPHLRPRRSAHRRSESARGLLPEDGRRQRAAPDLRAGRSCRVRARATLVAWSLPTRTPLEPKTPGTVLRRTVPGRAGAAWWPGRARTARRTGPSQRRPQWSRLLLGLEAGPHVANQPAGSLLPLAVLARPSRARLQLQSERPRLARRTGGRARSAAASSTAPGSRRAAGRCRVRPRSPQCRCFRAPTGAFGSARSHSSIRHGIATPSGQTDRHPR
jgi:hypothetical protein